MDEEAKGDGKKLDRWFKLRALAAFQRIQLQYPTPMSDSLKLPVIPASEGQHSLMASTGTCTNKQIHTQIIIIISYLIGGFWESDGQNKVRRQ